MTKTSLGRICLILIILQFYFTNLIIAKSLSKTKQTSYYTLIRTIKRITPYYTQGMFFTDDGKNLIESSGLYGQSTLNSMQYPSLILNKRMRLPSNYFAEGTAKCGNYIYLLTWMERVIYVFSYPNLNYISKIAMPTLMREGWGLATLNQNELIASDGSSNIYVLDCNYNLRVKRIIQVSLNGYYLYNINALNYAQGFIWANVYFDKRIFKISAITGNVLATYDMSALVNYEFSQGTLTSYNLSKGNVLNGIAYNPVTMVWVLTGKLWGFYYEVTFN